jgi:hypothetical protein
MSSNGRKAMLALGFLLALALASTAQAQAPVGLGTTGSFGVLGGTTVTNTGPTVVNGDLGVSPGAAVTGFPPGTVNGAIHAADAVALQAKSDLVTAYDDAAGRACTAGLTGQDLGGMTLTAGVYCFTSAAQLTGTLVFDAQGNPDAVLIFKIASTLTTASASTVSLINGAQSCNIFWQVGSSATLGTTTTFRGNVFALTSIAAQTGATVDGRLLARNAATTLDSNTITRAQCAAGTTGGPAPAADVARPTVIIGGGPGDSVPGNPVRTGPKPCIATDFRLRITARDASGIRRVSVYLDGRLIKRVTHRRFLVTVHAAQLVAGTHTMRVVAVDRAGNTRVQTRTFNRCALPAFTG